MQGSKYGPLTLALTLLSCFPMGFELWPRIWYGGRRICEGPMASTTYRDNVRLQVEFNTVIGSWRGLS